MNKCKIISISIELDVLDSLDCARGRINRSRYVNDILKEVCVVLVMEDIITPSEFLDGFESIPTPAEIEEYIDQEARRRLNNEKIRR